MKFEKYKIKIEKPKKMTDERYKILTERIVKSLEALNVKVEKKQ